MPSTLGSLAILAEFEFPSGTVRLWDGSGPLMIDGRVWAGCGAVQGLDELEVALNGEASSLSLSLSGVGPEVSNLAWQDHQAGDVVGSRVRLMIQPMDDYFQPTGMRRVPFTGLIDNIIFDEASQEDGIVSLVTIEVTNRFDLRNLISGAALSDADHQLRYPGDKFCERVPGLIDKAIAWPNFG